MFSVMESHDCVCLFSFVNAFLMETSSFIKTENECDEMIRQIYVGHIRFPQLLSSYTHLRGEGDIAAVGVHVKFLQRLRLMLNCVCVVFLLCRCMSRKSRYYMI